MRSSTKICWFAYRRCWPGWLVGWSDRKNLTDHETSLSAALRQPPGTLNQDSSSYFWSLSRVDVTGHGFVLMFPCNFYFKRKVIGWRYGRRLLSFGNLPWPWWDFQSDQCSGSQGNHQLFFKLRFITIDMLIIGGSKCGPGGDSVQGPRLWWSRTCSSCWRATALSWAFLPGGQDENVHHDIFF